MVIQVWRITNALVTQVRDLAGKVTHPEEEKERKHESEGHHEVHPVDEIETLLEELRSIAAEGGENSALYKRKQKLLENVLRLRHEESLRHNPPAPTGGGEQHKMGEPNANMPVEEELYKQITYVIISES